MISVTFLSTIENGMTKGSDVPLAHKSNALGDAAPLTAAIYPFDHPHRARPRALTDLLGGKGAGLAEMISTLGINVPPGFTISVPLCQRYRREGWPEGLDEAIALHTSRLGDRMGRRFGDHNDPLLVAVRSGAPVSMPGMLDTVLNLGLNEYTVEGLAKVSGDEKFAWDSYRRFLHMYATTVMGVHCDELYVGHSGDTTESLREHVVLLRERIRQVAGRDVPAEPTVQLREAVEAVFRSWDSQRARTYRAKEGIDESMGTAVNVQAMVFGNRGLNSGTGVVFTRDPSTGEAVLYGDYLPMAQGEDVVAGTAHTLPIADLEQLHPAIYTELQETLRRLEVHYRDVCDVEFTIENGRLWLLQTRAGKRSAVAAVRIAVDLVNDPDIRLTPTEAVSRVPAAVRQRARDEALAHVGADDAAHDLVTTGLGASPGRAVGRVVLTSDEAADADDDVILVRPETKPEDVAGMAASVGLLTTKGGLVSHAAVVARGWNIPAVVGAQDLTCSANGIHAPSGLLIRVGDVITIDGTTGQVWRGAVTTAMDEIVIRAIEHELPQLPALEEWARQYAHEGEEQ
ncbi:pyruvate, phosphate dikinase [Rhodococcus aetherivorans]|uniref:pyruvate, phosphate dikinase n=1 Tax=Rhodococcus aetherivorans TaxID=191292 RepID=UPI0021A2E54B|nr:pyruvate, phosphate dikinase [Rhodococcus aetherivorans]